MSHSRVFSLASLSTALLLSGCGAGESSTEITYYDQDPYQPELVYADSYADSVDLLSQYFDYTTISSWYSYDADFHDYYLVYGWTGSDAVLDWQYYQSIQPYQGISPSFPAIEAEIDFQSIGNNRELYYQQYNYSENQVESGEFQTFYGVSDAVYTGYGDIMVPIIIITRGIVEDSGSAVYQSVKIWEGYLLSASVFDGPYYSGIPGSLFSGQYSEYIVESYSSYYSRGLHAQYSVYLDGS